MSTIVGGRKNEDFVSSITVSLPVEVIRTLNKLTQDYSVSRSAIVSQAVNEFLERLETTNEDKEKAGVK